MRRCLFLFAFVISFTLSLLHSGQAHAVTMHAMDAVQTVEAYVPLDTFNEAPDTERITLRKEIPGTRPQFREVRMPLGTLRRILGEGLSYTKTREIEIVVEDTQAVPPAPLSTGGVMQDLILTDLGNSTGQKHLQLQFVFHYFLEDDVSMEINKFTFKASDVESHILSATDEAPSVGTRESYRFVKATVNIDAEAPLEDTLIELASPNQMGGKTKVLIKKSDLFGAPFHLNSQLDLPVGEERDLDIETCHKEVRIDKHMASGYVGNQNGFATLTLKNLNRIAEDQVELDFEIQYGVHPFPFGIFFKEVTVNTGGITFSNCEAETIPGYEPAEPGPVRPFEPETPGLNREGLRPVGEDLVIDRPETTLGNDELPAGNAAVFSGGACSLSSAIGVGATDWVRMLMFLLPLIPALRRRA